MRGLKPNPKSTRPEHTRFWRAGQGAWGVCQFFTNAISGA